MGSGLVKSSGSEVELVVVSGYEVQIPQEQHMTDLVLSKGGDTWQAFRRERRLSK